jgi:hypothetical protein
MNHLRSNLNVADKNIVAESNAERLDRSLAFALNPSLVGATPTADPGAPTAGARYEGELWADSACALWRCTVAGTPGTWLQILDALVADATARDAITTGPVGYRTMLADTGVRYMWDGAAWNAI